MQSLKDIIKYTNMNIAIQQNINPFSLTKSADMPDELIDKLWVSVEQFDIASKIKSLNPVFLIGGKGSGKTHLLRHHSYSLQKIRFSKQGINLLDGLKQDGYIGIYYRCKGLQASRFSGKGYANELWLNLFEYGFELTLSHELIFILSEIINNIELNKCLAKEIGQLLGIETDNLKVLEQNVADIRKKLYRAINNSAFGVDLKNDNDAKILVSRGDLIFGIPKILKTYIHDLPPCIYLIDEIENFEIDHQKYVNTLIREKEPEVSIKIGARRYGIKTDVTLSDGELLIEGSEKETIMLDNIYRLADNKKAYKEFLHRLLNNRVEQLGIATSINTNKSLVENLFEEYDPAWDDEKILRLVSTEKENERRYFRSLRKKLSEVPAQQVDAIVNLLSCSDYPVLEKVNIFNFYKECTKGEIIDAAQRVSQDCKEFLKGSSKKDSLLTGKALDYYKNNLLFQLRFEYNDKNFYNGIEDIIDMSEGMPRNFLQILKRMYDWAYQLEKNPFSGANISNFSADIQRKAIRESAAWFFEDVRECEDRNSLRECIDRLGQLLRINNFADLPKECSCISFAVAVEKLSTEARKIIKIAEEYSFLIEIPKGHKDKNHQSNVLKKYQLNKMLCPYWDLPIAKRGTKEFNIDEAEAIFNPNNADAYELIRNRWEKETTFALPTNKKTTPSTSAQGSLL